VLNALRRHHRDSLLSDPEPSQEKAWRDSVAHLQDHLATLRLFLTKVEDWGIVFEYELPRERGRRPDVLLVTHDRILVIEFKDYPDYTRAHLDQVRAYVRDLANYHSATHARLCVPILVNSSSRGKARQVEGVWIVPRGILSEFLKEIAPDSEGSAADLTTWLQAEYAPLPSLVAAARRIFNHEPLPSIRRAASAGIPETLRTLVAAATTAQRQGELHASFVTGVPGAGKTLAGLQLVYTQHFDEGEAERSAVFLSGNGPLVQVLQHALKTSVFVQDVHGFLREYGGKTDKTPSEHIWVYDEAQRAWDAERVAEKRGHPTSEPEDFIRLGARMPDWAMVVGLIGEGQEIHIGEEGGISQWNDAIRSSGRDWTVHCPARIAKVFTSAKQVVVAERLDLSTSLRSHLAKDVQYWASTLLEGDLDQAREAAARARHDGFDLYVTRDLEAAFLYVGHRYQGALDKRFGLLASSKAKLLPQFGIHNEWNYTKRVRVGPWYNDPPESRFSCCQLHDVVTEFSCQGLELDLPIVGWGEDLRWNDGSWVSRSGTRSKAKNPHQLRLNSYRVLLTRGRDGLVVFVPMDERMDSTAEALGRAGARPLE